MNDLSNSTGLILARYGQQVDVETATGNIERIYLHRKFDNIVTGDKVTLESDHHHLVITKRLPRASLLEKCDARGKIKSIAANIDQLVLVIAPEPMPSFGLIDDYLVMSEALKIKPAIVLNKIDLLEKSSCPPVRPSLRGRVVCGRGNPVESLNLIDQLKIYQKLSYPVITTSTLDNKKFSSLIKLLEGKTNILVGQSGVGKSSIVQHLIPDLEIRIGELSRQRGKHGKHTTTTTRLYHLPNNACLIDSPGVRSFTLWPMPPEKMAAYFIEFQPYLGHCRFGNCQHTTEPGCPILEALKAGDIAESRYESYRRLIQK